MGTTLLFSIHGSAFLLQKDFKKSTMTDLSLKVYPQWGQQRRLQFLERRHPVHLISPSTNSFPHKGHFTIDFILIPAKNQMSKSLPAAGRQMSNQCQIPKWQKFFLVI